MDNVGNGTLVSLRNVAKQVGSSKNRVDVLRDVTLDVAAGEFITITGPSGAGKSTLLSILGMLEGDWTGEYVLDGHPVHSLRVRHRLELNRRYVGFVFQHYHLLDDLTVRENLEVPLSYRDVSRSERRRLVEEALERFGIESRQKLYPAQLSGGEQQLVAVARAVIASPSLILADEPTGSLHSDQGKDIMELLKRLNDAGTTIIQVTHNVAYAAYGNREIKLKDGSIV